MLELAPARGAAAAHPGGDQRVRTAMKSTIRLVELQAGPTAVARATMRPDAIAGWLGRTLPRIAVTLKQQEVSRIGPPFARYTVHGDLVEVEAGFRIRDAIARGSTVTASGLPGGMAAVATHVGSAAALDVVYDDMQRWLDENGLVEAGPHWEVYPVDPRLVSDAGLTRVVVPCRHHTDPLRPGVDVRAYVDETAEPDDHLIQWPVRVGRHVPRSRGMAPGSETNSRARSCPDGSRC